MQKPKHIHSFRQSFLNDVWKCPEYARRKHAGIVDEQNNSDFVRGNSVHNTIEAFGLEWLHSNTQMPLSTVLELGERCFEEESAIPDTKWRAKPEAILEQISQRLNVWYDQVLPILNRPSSVEQKFKVLAYEDDDRKIYFSGTPDWVEGTPGDPDARIIDWKNPKGAPRDEWIYRRSNLQSNVYSFALQIDNFSLCHLTNKPEPTWIHMGRQGQEHQALIAMCLNLAYTLEANLPALPQQWDSWFCSQDWCPAWADCRGRYLTADVETYGRPIDRKKNKKEMEKV